jgi:hypothetical protein
MRGNFGRHSWCLERPQLRRPSPLPVLEVDVEIVLVYFHVSGIRHQRCFRFRLRSRSPVYRSKDYRLQSAVPVDLGCNWTLCWQHSNPPLLLCRLERPRWPMQSSIT